MQSWNDIAKELVLMVKDGVKDGTKVISEKFPELCKQIVKFTIVGSGFLCFVFFIATLILTIVEFMLLPHFISTCSKGTPEGFLIFMPFVVIGILLTFLFFGMCCKIERLIKAIYAPMLCIFEELKEQAGK